MIISLDEFLKLKLEDEVFIIETDTVYGMGCLYNSEKGAKRILEIKNRSNEKHFSLLVSGLDQVKFLAKDYGNSIDLIEKYWPGALTLIFKKTELVKDFVSKSDTVGLRMPNNLKTLEALNKFGPMIMTSVNNSGDPAIVKFDECLKFESDVDFIVKGEDLSSIPSTVYDTTTNKILREGSVKLF